MFFYCLLILFANIYSSSVGTPISTVAQVLDKLQHNCDNAAVAAQISNKSVNCSDLPQKLLMKCLLFYDINVKLCKVPTSINDQLASLKEVQSVHQFCNNVKNWNFTDLEHFPTLKARMENYFSKPLSCEKLCEVDDFDSDDTDFFCKYYQWGINLLAQEDLKIIEGKPPTETGELSLNKTNVLSKPQLPQNSHIADNKLIPTSEVAINSGLFIPADENQPINPPVSASGLGSHVDKTENKVIIQQQKFQLGSNINALNIERVETSNAIVKKENSDPSELEPLSSKDGSNKDGIPLPDPVPPKQEMIQPSKKSQKPVIESYPKLVDQAPKPVNQAPEKNQQASNLAEQVPNPADQAPKQDDYGNVLGEDKDGMGDMQGEDDPDTDDNFGDGNIKLNQESVKKVDIPISSFGDMQKEYIANPIVDGFTSDEDDHFFPFFLTTVVMVVLLYVLYHNKNKVGKLFLGLLVEGRSARRRNSRGHAYRRLDTLEQAISTDTAAAPSKIIY